MDSTTDSDAVLHLLEKWRNRARMNQQVHYARSKELHRYNTLLGIPATFVTAVIGTSIFATLNQDVVFWVKVTAGVTSLTASVLSGLQTFLRFSEQAAQHHSVAAAYGAINRSIEAAQAFPFRSQEESRAFIEEIRKKMDELPKQAPAISDKLWRTTPLHLTPSTPTSSDLKVPGRGPT